MKKRFLSVAALLALITVSGCDPVSSASSASPGVTTSEQAVSSSPTTSENISSLPVPVTHSLRIEGPVQREYETGEVFDFAAITVKLIDEIDEETQAETTLSRDQYTVTVNNQTVDGNFTFDTEGTVTFVIASMEHPEATGSFSVHVTTYYSIVNASADFVVLKDLPFRSAAGEEISFTLTLLPGYYLDGEISIVDGNDQAVAYQEQNYRYTFTMPASAVTISVDTGVTDFTIAKDEEFIDKVVLENDSDGENVFSAVPGTALKFRTNASDDYVFTEVYLDGDLIEEAEDGYYHFVMPHHPVSITTNKQKAFYSVTANLADLILSEGVMYVDPDTKEPIASATKGQRVYLSFTYSVTLVKYTIEAVTSDGTAVPVTQIEGEDTFYFDMVSSDITVTVAEEDWSTYYGYYVTDKVWKTYNLYTTSNRLDAKETADLTSVAFQFESNGRGWKNTTGMDWSIESDGTSGYITAHVDTAAAGVVREFYYTPNLIVSKFDDTASAKWQDAYVGTWSEKTVHALVFNSSSRLIWIEDDDGAISENILIHNETVYTNVELTTDGSVACAGSDITTTSHFFISHADISLEVNACVVLQTFQITAEASEVYSIQIKDKDGNDITAAKNGETVYVYGALADDADPSLSISGIKVVGSSSVSTTAISGEENAWSFVMPVSDVTISLTIEDPNKYAGYPAVGEYIGYNLYSSRSDDVDFATSSITASTWSVTAAGKLYMNGTSSDIVSMSEGDYGTIVASRTYNFGGGIIVTPYSSSKDDVYVAVKVPSGTTKSSVRTEVHYISRQAYGIVFYVDNVLAGSLFMADDTFYCGAEFTFEEGTTRIGAEGTYHVSYQGVMIYDVVDGAVSAHAA